MANVALIASTVLLLVWWATDHGNANTPRDERDPEAGVDAAVWHASVEPSASGARHTVATVEDDEVRVEARSDGRALADVEIGCRPADANPGWIDQDVWTRLGRTGTRGRLTCSWPDLAGRVLTARRDGFLATDVAIGSERAGEVIRVELQPAAVLTVSCRTRDGNPIRGVEVSISRSDLPEGRAPDDGFARRRPAGTASMAIHSATTAADGRARLPMLPPGRLCVQVHHPHYCRVAEGSRYVELSAGSHEVSLLFDPLLLAVGIVTDDPVLSWSAKTPKAAYIDASVLEQTQWVSPWWSRITGATPLCFAGAARWLGERYAEIDDRMMFDVFTESYGSCRIAVRLERAEVWRGPDLVVVGLTRSQVASSNLRVVLKDPSSRLFDCLAGISMRHRGGSGLVRIPLGNRAGIAFRLPDGDYEFRTNQPFLERHIDGVSCTVDGDDQIELEIPMAVRSCRIEWLHPDSDRLADDGVVTFSWRDQQHRVVMSHGLSAFRWTLPVGTVQVALVSESGSFAGQLSVVAGNGEQVTQLRMNR